MIDHSELYIYCWFFIVTFLLQFQEYQNRRHIFGERADTVENKLKKNIHRYDIISFI